jgi:tetratricopeptide (TPR) repeat protein
VFTKAFVVLFMSQMSFMCCKAQDITHNLLPLSPVERVRYMSGYMESNNLVNTSEFDTFLEQLRVFAKQQNDALLLSHIDYLIAGTPIFREENSYKKIELIKELQAECQQKNDLIHVGDCLVAMAQIQFADEEYAPAFENMLAADEFFKKIGYENIPNMGKYLHDFALDYFFFQDYEKVIEYMKASVKLPKYNDNLDIQRYNTLGVSYLKLNQPDSAFSYLSTTYEKAKTYNDSIWLGLSAGNLGEVFYRKGEYQKALDYFEEDFQINHQSNSPDIPQNAAVNMAKTYLRLGDMNKASQYLKVTAAFFPKPKINTFGNQQQLEQAKRNYYQVSYGYYLALEDYKTALLYADSLHRAEKIHDRKYNALQVKMASGQLELLQSKMELQKKELLHEKQRRVKNVIISSLGVVFFLGIFIFRSRQKINKQKQLLLNAQLERAKHHLNISQIKLDDFASRIQEKSKLIEGLEQKLSSQPDADDSLLVQLQQVTILTEDDWKHFKSLFEQVHSGFLQRLKEKYPEISPAEIRFLTLAKLSFSTKEMAAALGVSTQSIRTNWYRIRKKLELPETLSVEELVAEV